MSFRALPQAALILACAPLWLGCTAGTAKPADARQKGMQAARDDIARGVLKQKEYPPLPYSLQMMNYIKLIKAECGVQWEVVSSPKDSKELREEVAGYNEVMRAEIAKRFGADIFAKLQKKAEGKNAAGPAAPGAAGE